MKRILFAMVVAVLIIAVGWYFIYTQPVHVHRTLSGLQYHADEPSASVRTVTVQVNGTMQRSLRGKWTFKGTIKLQGTTQPNPDNNLPLTIPFSSDGDGEIRGAMNYLGIKNGTPYVHTYGSIFTNHDFNKVVILEARHGWSSTGGLTITAPASNRSIALSISNKLMKGWLGAHAVK